MLGLARILCSSACGGLQASRPGWSSSNEHCPRRAGAPVLSPSWGNAQARGLALDLCSWDRPRPVPALVPTPVPGPAGAHVTLSPVPLGRTQSEPISREKKKKTANSSSPGTTANTLNKNLERTTIFSVKAQLSCLPGQVLVNAWPQRSGRQVGGRGHLYPTNVGCEWGGWWGREPVLV